MIKTTGPNSTQFVHGIMQQVSALVEMTYGPRGGFVILSNGDISATTKDGVSVIKSLVSTEPLEQAVLTVIKEAALDLEVADAEEAKALAEAEVKSLGGFITNMNSWEVRVGVLAYRMTIRVPAEKLDIAIENLTKLGVKKSENFSSRDITAQYTDTEAQIKNLKTRRTRLRKLLEFETKNLADVLQVDRELNNLQNQLDRLMRTQKGRDEKVAYSTLTLTLNPKTQIGDLTNPEWNPENHGKARSMT